MSNYLAGESSPYLLQHAQNPVQWYPWGQAALSRARREDKPIFLSIGYSACHWCHVMEHESFENDRIASILNQHFINIKVDREERPDLDHIYMQAVMAVQQGRGGWPLSVFLTPQQEVFFGGTYWPPTSRIGMPGFDQVLRSVLDAFNQRREQVDQQSQQITSWLNRSENPSDLPDLNHQPLFAAVQMLEKAFDPQHGGFGDAPKFPHTMDLSLLRRLARRWPEHRAPGRESMLQMVHVSLTKMAQGGIFDHLGGGFARYSVDEYWLVPHFEKMLYDNALLSSNYLDMVADTADPFFADVARKTLDYLLHDMTDEQGCLYSSEDADSEGIEGKFYVWSKREIMDALGEDCGGRFCDYYDVTEHGNFEGSNILNTRKTFHQFADLHGLDVNEVSEELESARQRLLSIRNQRVRPGRDDKVIVSWNALAISALTRAAMVLGENQYGQAAETAADFILREMRDESGRLLHTWRLGHAKLAGFLDDYAFLIVALLDLYQLKFDPLRLQQADQLTQVMLQHFARPEGGFFFTADDQEKLISRPLTFLDSSIPSGNAMAALALLRLGRITGDVDRIELARNTIAAAMPWMSQSPLSCGQMLIALEKLLMESLELVVVTPDEDQQTQVMDMLREAKLSDHSIICQLASEQPTELLKSVCEGKTLADGKSTLYICRGFRCEQPVVGLPAMESALRRLSEDSSGYPLSEPL